MKPRRMRNDRMRSFAHHEATAASIAAGGANGRQRGNRRWTTHSGSAAWPVPAVIVLRPPLMRNGRHKNLAASQNGGRKKRSTNHHLGFHLERNPGLHALRAFLMRDFSGSVRCGRHRQPENASRVIERDEFHARPRSIHRANGAAQRSIERGRYAVQIDRGVRSSLWRRRTESNCCAAVPTRLLSAARYYHLAPRWIARLVGGGQLRFNTDERLAGNNSARYCHSARCHPPAAQRFNFCAWRSCSSDRSFP